MAKNILKMILLPNEEKFFPMFEDLAEQISKAAHLLQQVIESSEPSMEMEAIRQIKSLENKADEIVHKVFDMIDSTFITPFDREDIQRLASKMDDVMDFLNAASQKIKLYKPHNLLAQVREINQIVVRSCEQIRIAVPELRNLKQPDKINLACQKISELENSADELYHIMLSDLFENEKNPFELIKNKEILETLESTTDRAADVADVLRTIIIKSA
jgi:predicted phosphate transport protein (TIGR00153 family)